MVTVSVACDAIYAPLLCTAGSLQFTFKHPIASCVMTFIVASSGSILANLALARPPLEAVVNGWAVLACSLCW